MVFLFLLHFLPFCLFSLVFCKRRKDDVVVACSLEEEGVVEQERVSKTDAIWNLKMEFDGLDPHRNQQDQQDYSQRVREDFEKIRKICHGHRCLDRGKPKAAAPRCLVCRAYMEWACDQYKQSYKYEELYPEEMRETLEEYFFYVGRRPLCVENPFWQRTRKGIKGGNKKQRKVRMQQEKEPATSIQAQNVTTHPKDTAGSNSQTAKSVTSRSYTKRMTQAPRNSFDEMLEKADIIRQCTRESIQWFNKNGKTGKPSPEECHRLPKGELKPEDEAKYSKEVVELLKSKKEYGSRVADEYDKVSSLYNEHECEYPVKKVSEEEPCQLCAAFVDWAGEQYEESYRDGRYPEEVRQAIEKDLYRYKGKPPLCITNPYWPKAKDRIRRARPRWELKEDAGEEGEEESSERPGLLQGGQSISMETVDERRSRETAGTPPEVSAVETPAGTPQIETALENTQKTLRTAKDQKSQQRRMKTAASGSRTAARQSIATAKMKKRAGSAETAKTPARKINSMETAKDQKMTKMPAVSTRKQEQTAKTPERPAKTPMTPKTPAIH